ncbi:unnamed protein product [Fraxinus pennsylvanica]|uniref:Uncharacterized protein n=1 Tax=Fraxinus pennsylvanica TaxID=56036 RepID=A0AAD1Z6J4_9LAMI|nr:unnamed protein product [Fraxinus pennsylvanica]
MVLISRRLSWKLDLCADATKNSEPFRGKSGSVSFGNITHHSVEESQLVSAPFKENSGSLLWVLAPVALISSLVVPQFFVVNAVEDFLKNEVLAVQNQQNSVIPKSMITYFQFSPQSNGSEHTSNSVDTLLLKATYAEHHTPLNWSDSQFEHISNERDENGSNEDINNQAISQGAESELELP